MLIMKFIILNLLWIYKDYLNQTRLLFDFRDQ
jgi:hypothetical protein